MERSDTASGQQAGNGRLLRVWSLLEATREQIDHAALPPEGMSGCSGSFRKFAANLKTRYPRLRRIAPSLDEASSAARAADRVRSAYELDRQPDNPDAQLPRGGAQVLVTPADGSRTKAGAAPERGLGRG